MLEVFSVLYIYNMHIITNHATIVIVLIIMIVIQNMSNEYNHEKQF